MLDIRCHNKIWSQRDFCQRRLKDPQWLHPHFFWQIDNTPNRANLNLDTAWHHLMHVSFTITREILQSYKEKKKAREMGRLKVGMVWEVRLMWNNVSVNYCFHAKLRLKMTFSFYQSPLKATITPCFFFFNSCPFHPDCFSYWCDNHTDVLN